MTNGGIIALGTTLTSNNLTTTPGSTLTLSAAHVGGNLLNGGAIETQGAQGTINVKRDIVNRGSLKGAFLALTTPGGVVRKLSGSGVWNFSALGIPSGYTAELNSDVTFDIAGFSNNGTLNYRNNTLNFNGSSFGGNGAAAGTGTLRFTPTGGSAIFNGNGPAVTIASGTVEYQSGGTISGPFTIDNGATFAMNTSGILTVNNDVTINGSLVKTGGNPEFVFNGLTFINNGSFSGVDFLTFNDSGAPNSQLIAGFGAWSPTNVQIGGSSLSTAFVTLQNDVTLASNQLFTSTGSTLSVGNHTLTMTGPTGFFGGKISGTGLVKMLPSSGTPRLGGPFFSLSIDPDLEIASGTVKATRTIVGGKLTVDAGATLSLFGSTGIETNGDVMNNGTLNAFSDGPSLNFKGDTFTNRGAVTGNVYVNLGVNLASPRAQKLAGTGSWTASPRLFIDALSSTTLLNDVTYDGGNLFVEGKINTGAFTFSLPCAVSWSGAGEVVGNIRRTNLAACPGAAIAYGNPFTTIAFNSGTPPTEINVNVALSAPPGFANAVRRTYKITPTGGSDFTATLRLRYLDSELNGNDEATLQLLRQDGIGWSPQGATGRDTANNWVENANVTRFSTWTLSSLAPPPLPTTFANWRQGFFTTQELGDAAISGELADPDNDGVSNLLEYAFHFDPKDPSSANRPYGMKEGAYFSLIYTRTLAATDLTYIVEGSSGLSGAWPAVNPTNTILADDGVTQTVKAQVPVTDPQTFLRLRVSH